jgi:hypothetical protein
MAKGKGSAYERSVCKALSLWWSGGVSDDVFWRTSQSGGRATTRRKQGKDTRAHCGDLCALDNEGAALTRVITLELKRGYSKYTIHDILDRSDRAAQQMFEAFICQAIKAAENAGSPYWMLIHKRDKREEMVYFPNTLMREFKDFGYGSLPIPYVEFRANITKGKFVRVVGMRLKTFFDTMEPSEIRILDNRLKKRK